MLRVCACRAPKQAGLLACLWLHRHASTGEASRAPVITEVQATTCPAVGRVQGKELQAQAWGAGRLVSRLDCNGTEMALRLFVSRAHRHYALFCMYIIFTQKKHKEPYKNRSKPLLLDQPGSIPPKLAYLPLCQLAANSGSVASLSGRPLDFSGSNFSSVNENNRPAGKVPGKPRM